MGLSFDGEFDGRRGGSCGCLGVVVFLDAPGQGVAAPNYVELVLGEIVLK
jgi:hypothetical protein